jgi:hypothetical protein
MAATRGGAMATAAHPAVKAVEELADDYDEALNLLDDFCDRFFWIKDHPDYQQTVRDFLSARGRKPRPYKH